MLTLKRMAGSHQQNSFVVDTFIYQRFCIRKNYEKDASELNTQGGQTKAVQQVYIVL